MHAQLLGFPTALGRPRLVWEAGPAALRRLGLVQALEHVLEVTDLGFSHHFKRVVGVTPRQFRRSARIA